MCFSEDGEGLGRSGIIFREKRDFFIVIFLSFSKLDFDHRRKHGMGDGIDEHGRAFVVFVYRIWGKRYRYPRIRIRRSMD
jgi:hypothetical protein